MSKEYTVKVHTISEDGLPDMEKLVGRVAFIWDGAICSGWPTELADPSDPESMQWESSEDALGGLQLYGVKKWIELPVAGWEL